MGTRQLPYAVLVGVLALMPCVAAEDKATHSSPTPNATAPGNASASQTAAAPATVPAPPPAHVPPPPPPAPKYKTKEEAIRAQLDGTSWAITLSPVDETSKARPKTDTLTFEANAVNSERLTRTGYAPSHYSLTVQGDTAVWDTMQSHEQEGTVLWHGEVRGGMLRGIVSERPQNGKNVDFNLSGSETSGNTIKVPSQSELQPAQAAPAAPKDQYGTSR